MYSSKSFTINNGIHSKKPNQDNHSIWYKDENNETPKGFIGVYDGHGHHGHIVSEIIKNFFLELIPAYWNELNNDFNNTIKYLFNYAQTILYKQLIEYFNNLKYSIKETELIINNVTHKQILYKKYKYDLWSEFTSGTTCSLVIILDDNTFYHVHLGDSECVIFDKNHNNELYYKCLTKNHSPTSIEEYKRIIQNYEKPGLFKYNINNYYHGGPNIFDKIDDIIVAKDPYELYNNYPKMHFKNVEKEFASYFIHPNKKNILLSMTRSFGNFHLVPYGVSYEPEIIKYDFTDNTIILLASDGLWDNWKKIELFNKFNEWINTGLSLDEIFNLLVKITDKEAFKNFGSSKDDITLILSSKTF